MGSGGSDQVARWGLAKNKTNLAQLELELGLSLAIEKSMEVFLLYPELIASQGCFPLKYQIE